MTMLSVHGLRAGYGKIEVLHDVAHRRRAGADRDADRRERRRQDHAAEDHFRADPPERRQRSSSKARTSRAGRRTRSSRRGMSHVPEGRAILKRMTVIDNLRMGAYVRSDTEVDRDIDAVFERFPVLAERRDQMAGNAVRRRAADAGDRPRAGGAPAPAAARRALARARAQIRHADFPDAARAQSRRAKPSFWSSRMRARPCRLPTAATSWSAGASRSAASGQELLEHAGGAAHLSGAERRMKYATSRGVSFSGCRDKIFAT